MPGSPSASWHVYKSRIKSAFDGVDFRVLVAFWLFGK